MTLYIVRHAFAGERGDPRYPDDSLRPITKKGRKRFERLVAALVKVGFAPRWIGTSPYVRCTQTADVLVDHLEDMQRAELVDAFAPGCGTQDVLNWMCAHPQQDLAYVGHAPDVDSVAAELLGAPAEAVHFSKGAIAAIEFPEAPAPRAGILRWLVSPKLIG